MLQQINLPVFDDETEQLDWGTKSLGDSLVGIVNAAALMNYLGAQAGIQADSIVSVDPVVISPIDSLSVTLEQQSASALYFRVLGGVLNNVYTINLTFTTQLNNVISRNLFLGVASLSSIYILGVPTAVIEGPPGSGGGATQAQIVAALSSLPSYTAGAPPNGYWLGIDGQPQQAPIGSLNKFTNGNIGTILTAIGVT
jgi:hypothetical protein